MVGVEASCKTIYSATDARGCWMQHRDDLVRRCAAGSSASQPALLNNDAALTSSVVRWNPQQRGSTQTFFAHLLPCKITVFPLVNSRLLFLLQKF